jgi:type VI secretion system secreted protein Hcp
LNGSYPVYKGNIVADIFLKLAGISGESQDAKHKGEIDVLAWSWGLAETQGGQAAGSGAGAVRPNFQDLSIQKLTDLASPLLLAATIKGDNISEATLTVRSAGKLPQEFLVINLQNVMVTSISFGDAKAQDRPQESISIKFGKIAFDYTPFKADGTKEQQVSFKWDVVVNKEL